MILNETCYFYLWVQKYNWRESIYYKAHGNKWQDQVNHL